jgi:uncharacterized membrane protein
LDRSKIVTFIAPAPRVRTQPPWAPLNAAAVERSVLALATVSTGLIAGFYYAYACSVMLGLAQTDDRTFIATMQAINATVRNWWFAPSFFGSVLVTALAVVIGQVRRSPGRWWVGAAALLVAAGFALTMGVNVPLNDQLAAAGPAQQIGDPAAVRAAFEDSWVAWNIVRTVLSVAALVALVRATLLSRSRY